MELHELTVLELNNALRGGQVGLNEVIKHFSARIEELDPQIHAFLETSAIEPAVVNFNSSPLAGVPFAVKDNLVVENQSAWASSKILEGYKSPYTATSVKKLMDADGVVLGRTNCDEFAMGSSTENSAFGPTFNPWDVSRVPGGSSGGSAAAVAAGLVPFALGSDTGGSVRQPASFCGVVGVKPTYGRVSRYGLLALASSFDVVGLFTRTAEDAAIVLEYLAGHDPMDATTVNVSVPKYSEFVQKGVKGLRVGVPKEYFIKGMQSGVEDKVKDAIKKIESLGADIVEVSLPHSKYSLPAYYVILPVEASANLSRYDGIKYAFRAQGAGNLKNIYTQSRGQGFGREVKRRIMLGTYASSSGYYDAYYKQALKAQAVIKEDFKKVFEQVDVLATPTTPTTAFKVGEKLDNPLQMYLNDIFTVGVNIAGIPAMSIPAGFDQNLPVGLQIIAPWFKEELMFQVAGAYQAVTDWHKTKPPVW